MSEENVIIHANNPIDYIKLIYADRYDTTNPMFHSWYNGSLNTFIESEYNYYATLEELLQEIANLVLQYGESNVTLDYIAWRGVFRVLIAQ